jgi:hypothetical protein
MENKRFEILLKEDKNWLSKYGGFISLIIIILLVLGIFWIKIPEYEYLRFSKNNVPYIEVSKDRYIGEIGDSVMIDNHIIDGKILIIHEINNDNDFRIIYFKSINKSLSKENLKIITNKKTLLKSLLNPLLPNNKVE